LAIKTADANGSRVILASDPDVDRLALAEKQPEYVTAALLVFQNLPFLLYVINPHLKLLFFWH